MSSDPLPLTGPDCFLRAIDRETRSLNGSSHLSQLIVTLESPPKPGDVLTFFNRVVRDTPLLTARVRRPWGIQPPVYVPRTPNRRPFEERIRIHERSSLPDRPSPFRERLNQTFDLTSGELFYVDVVYADAKARLALTWSHMLLDGAGSEAFVDRLARTWTCWKTDDPLPAELSPSRNSPLTRFVDGRSWREKLRETRSWANQMSELAEPPPQSLSGPLTRTPQDLTWRRWTFGEATPEIQRRAESHAGTMRPMLFYLAVSLRAHDRVHRENSERPSPDAYLVPVPVDMRRGDPAPVFRTHVSFLWFQVRANRMDDFEHLVDTLREQRKRMIRESLQQRTAVALDTLRFLPAGLYRRMIRRPFGGEMASFFFSYTGEFLPDRETFMGAALTDGHHVPSVPVSPGSGLIWSLHRGRLNVTHVHQQDLLNPEERTLFRDQLQRDLLGEEGPDG